jgi:hypothetical protein
VITYSTVAGAVSTPVRRAVKTAFGVGSGTTTFAASHDTTGSVSRMLTASVGVAPRTTPAGCGFESATLKASVPSTSVSLTIGTAIVATACPALKLSVPETRA